MNFRVNTVVGNLLMLNILMFLAEMFIPDLGRQIQRNLMLFPYHSIHFEWWQPLTYMFLHGNFSHLFFNLFALWMFGQQLEFDFGARRFLFYYLFTGVGAAILNLWIMPLMGVYAPTIGASGAVFGILLAFGFLHPNTPLYLFFVPAPIKAKYYVIGYGVLELFLGVTNASSGVAHFAHIGGMVFGLILLSYWRLTKQI